MGKNPTNLKVHPKSARKANLAYLEKIKENDDCPRRASSGGTTNNQTARDEQPSLLSSFNQRDNQG